MYSDRTYIILPVSEIDKVDFAQVLETSADTIRKSADGSKTFIKWDGVEPTFVNQLNNTEGPYTHEEILNILANSEWIIPMPTGPTGN